MFRTIRSSRIRAALLFGGLAAGFAAIAAGAARQGFDEATSVVVVEVPVTVVRGDEPVRGLTANDFELYDGRKEQKITGFEVADATGAAAAATSCSSSTSPTPSPPPSPGRGRPLAS